MIVGRIVSCATRAAQSVSRAALQLNTPLKNTNLNEFVFVKKLQQQQQHQLELTRGHRRTARRITDMKSAASPTSPSSASSSFKLVSSISTKDDPIFLIPVNKYVSEATGLKLYVCHVPGPVVEGLSSHMYTCLSLLRPKYYKIMSFPV